MSKPFGMEGISLAKTHLSITHLVLKKCCANILPKSPKKTEPKCCQKPRASIGILVKYHATSEEIKYYDSCSSRKIFFTAIENRKLRNNWAPKQSTAVTNASYRVHVFEQVMQHIQKLLRIFLLENHIYRLYKVSSEFHQKPKPSLSPL